MAKPSLNRQFDGRTYVRRAYGLTKREAKRFSKWIKDNEFGTSVRTTYFKDASSGSNGMHAGYVVYSSVCPMYSPMY